MKDGCTADPTMPGTVDESAGSVVTASTVPVGSDRLYPLPRPEEDARFTFGLATDVCDVLLKHGYPRITSGRDLVELQQALYRFLYSGPAQEKDPRE